ncbi:polysaccharide biosynthesis/export family protein [Sphingomonas sp. KR1UV-12]|uniref:Polysaccharide biosynthesis/export family protein n=1 Tax=Sphingomonas aurea TaxID=3063994 RepID=A0ABT9EIM0_9SPHN|nr:polysaccharide biosynthesis/export family protein [Sphingomonas sp. KR1UV-12]MDP1026690.1 polysaccharide biosynthesis/export family protein [Sphingomonas sp. KR1UV-12]
MKQQLAKAMRSPRRSILRSAIAWAMASIAVVAPATLPAQAAVEGENYRIGVGDELEIAVFGQPEMSGKVRVRTDGTIGLAFLDAVKVIDRTPADIAAELSRRYVAGGYLKNPSVNVDVVTYAGRTVTVLGAVAKPGLYPLDRPYTVAEVVAKAGGTRADGANAVMLTHEGRTTRISLYDMAGAAAQHLRPGDSLFVPAEEQVFVYGFVNKPGGFAFQPGMTVRQALAVAGGPTLAGSTRRLKVSREGQEIRVALDEGLRPGDVLRIGEKAF